MSKSNNKVHLILQGKGGVGKSLIAAIIAQYKIGKGNPPLCIDTDPVNATFYGYQKLNVKRLEIIENEQINPRNFDKLIEMIAASDTDVIVDNGASSFVPLSHYLITNDVPQLLHEMGHELVIHTVITGGQALTDTLAGFDHLVSQFPKEAIFIVWTNPYWGPIVEDGVSLEKMSTYKTHKARISAILDIPELNHETFGADLAEMLQSKVTFDEAIASERNTIMTRQRLKIIKGKMFELMDLAESVI